MDRWMHEDPKLYKYECTKHDTCKKYFKKAYSLRKHLKRMGDKEYPTNISRFFRPEIPPDQATIKDYELPPTPPPRTQKEVALIDGVEAKRRKKKIVKKRDKKGTINSAITTSFSGVNVTPPSTVTTEIIQNAVSGNLVAESTSSQHDSDLNKSIIPGKRGRKKKSQNIAIVQVPIQASHSPVALSQLGASIELPAKESETRRTSIATAYAPSSIHSSRLVVAPNNTVIVNAENVKVEIDNQQTQANAPSGGAIRALNTAANLNTTTVIPIQHPTQLFHQIHVQQQPQVQQTDQMVQQHTHVAATVSQPITEHVWVSGHQVFYNTR